MRTIQESIMRTSSQPSFLSATRRARIRSPTATMAMAVKSTDKVTKRYCRAVSMGKTKAIVGCCGRCSCAAAWWQRAPSGLVGSGWLIVDQVRMGRDKASPERREDTSPYPPFNS